MPQTAELGLLERLERMLLAARVEGLSRTSRLAAMALCAEPGMSSGELARALGITPEQFQAALSEVVGVPPRAAALSAARAEARATAALRALPQPTYH
jgi:transposase-like protein